MPGRRTLFGLGLFAVGTFVLGQRIGSNAELGALLREWWPLAVVAFGLVNLIRMVGRPWAWAVATPLGVIAIGAILLLHDQGHIDPDIYPLLWPSALVLAGLWVALAGADWSSSSPTTALEFRRFVWLRGERIVRRPGPLAQGTIMVLLGAVKLDLRAVDLAQQCTIDVWIIFGAVEVLVADRADVEQRRAFVLGRGKLQYTTLPPQDAELTVNVLGLFGDVTVTRTSLWVTSREASTQAAGGS
jgi:hypothetical protein